MWTSQYVCFTADVFFQRVISEVPQPIAAKLCRMGRIVKTKSHNLEPSPWNLGDFAIDREYLRNGARYRQSQNGVANYNLSCVLSWGNLMNFGRGTADVLRAAATALCSDDLQLSMLMKQCVKLI